MLLATLIPAYIPHGHCYLWQTGLVGLHVTADALIALSYFSIPIALAYIARKRQDLPFKEIFILFSAFIIFCGVTHLMAIWTLWHPDYWQSGLLKAITALISVITAATLVPIVPKALNLPSPAALETANAALAKEIVAHQAAERQLQRQNQLLTKAFYKLRQTQAVLVQNEKMSSLGQLVAGITHELNNPISFIYGNLYHLQTYANDLFRLLETYRCCHADLDQRVATVAREIDLEFLVQDLPGLITSMQIGTSRIREIVSSLQNFSRLDEAGFKPVNVHDLLDTTLTILSSRLRANRQHLDIAVEKQYGAIPKVEGHPGNLNQVFLHVLTNAVDAIEARSQTRHLALMPPPPGRIEITTSTPDAQRVQIAIRDNGVGIVPAIKDRIFDPFFTTKSVGRGIGMGLAVSYQIVTNQHSGSLRCQSTPGEGTTVTIELLSTPFSDACSQAETAELMLMQSLEEDMLVSL